MRNNKLPSSLYLIHFYIAYALFSLAEGFFVLLPIHIKFLGGDEFTVGKIIFYGTFGSVFSILTANYFLKRIQTELLMCAATGFYALVCIIIYTATKVNFSIHCCGFLLGAGTGIFVGVSPLLIHHYIKDSERNFHYSFMSGLGILGIGLSPLIVFRSISDGKSYNSLMMIVFILCGLAFLGFYSLKYYKVKVQPISQETILWSKLIRLSVLRDDNIFLSLAIAFLFGCIFSAMINFQSTYALQQNLQSQYFYISFVGSIIMVRFFLGSFMAKCNIFKATSLLFICLLISLCIFPFITENNLYYACDAIFLGLSYGLVFPLIQSNTINMTPVYYRPQMLLLFSFAYFISTYSFPYLTGWIIVNYGYTVLFITLASIVAIQILLNSLFFNFHKSNLKPRSYL